MAKSGQIDFSKAIQDVQTIVGDVQSTKSDCNLGYGAAYGVGGFEECLNDISGIVTAAEDIFSQLKSGNPDFAKLLQDAETIEQDVVSAEADCKLSTLRTRPERVGGIQNCITDVEGVAESAMDILKQLKTGSPDMNQII